MGSKTLVITGKGQNDFLQTRRPSCDPTNSIRHCSCSSNITITMSTITDRQDIHTVLVDHQVEDNIQADQVVDSQFDQQEVDIQVAGHQVADIQVEAALKADLLDQRLARSRLPTTTTNSTLTSLLLLLQQDILQSFLWTPSSINSC